VRNRRSIEGWHWILDTQLHGDAYRYKDNGAGELCRPRPRLQLGADSNFVTGGFGIPEGKLNRAEATRCGS